MQEILADILPEAQKSGNTLRHFRIMYADQYFAGWAPASMPIIRPPASA